MKTNFILPLFLLFLAFTNCSNDDDFSNSITINGTWNLTKVSGGLAGVDDNFDRGTILWTFNETTSVLTVVNNNMDDTLIDYYESGDFPYVLVDDTLTINNNVVGSRIVSLSASQLILDDNIPADGFGLTLER